MRPSAAIALGAQLAIISQSLEVIRRLVEQAAVPDVPVRSEPFAIADHRQLLATRAAFSVKEVQAITGLDYSTVLHLIHTSQLRAQLAGRGYLVSSGALIDYLNGDQG
jgi:hypothetical protein